MQSKYIAKLARDIKKPELRKLLKTHDKSIRGEEREKVEHSAAALLEYLLAEENKKVGSVMLGTFSRICCATKHVYCTEGG